MTIRLLNKTSATILRHNTGAGYYDENGDWVSAPTYNEICVRGSFQPEWNQSLEKVLPEGTRSADCRLWLSSTELLYTSEKTKTQGDYLKVGDVEYEVVYVMHYIAASPRLSHYQCVVKRRDLI